MFRTSKNLFFLSAGLALFSLTASAQDVKKSTAAEIALSTDDNQLSGKEAITVSATDSTKLSKDKSLLKLYGNAKLNSQKFNVMAEEITYNRNTKKIIARNYKAVNNNTGVATAGQYGELSIKE